MNSQSDDSENLLKNNLSNPNHSQNSEQVIGKKSRISWYPGHIKVAKEQLIKKWFPLIDIVVELIDGRLPISSAVEEITTMTSKPVIKIFTKKDLCDLPVLKSTKFLVIDGRNPHEWKKQLVSIIKDQTAEVSAKLALAGRKRRLRIGVCGLPNVGKSTFFNSMIKGRGKAKTNNKPGTTRHNMWVHTEEFDLLDSPGIIDTSLDESRAYKLAFCNLLPQKLFDPELLLKRLLDELIANGYDAAAESIKNKISQYSYEELIGKFQMGKFGKFCLDKVSLAEKITKLETGKTEITE